MVFFVARDGAMLLIIAFVVVDVVFVDVSRNRIIRSSPLCTSFYSQSSVSRFFSFARFGVFSCFPDSLASSSCVVRVFVHPFKITIWLYVGLPLATTSSLSQILLILLLLSVTTHSTSTSTTTLLVL